ncbi:MAG: hypothetical protein FWH03_04950 [Firmicutes bacterium]|nr:hypothetical protein [Bacillota bacterium]
MESKTAFKISGILQIIWSVVAVLFGGFALVVFVLIASSGGFGPNSVPAPLTTNAILFFVFIGLVILGGCGIVLFLGIKLILKNKLSKSKSPISIASIAFLCVPPLVGIYMLIRSASVLPNSFMVFSPMFIILISPIIMVITNVLSLLYDKFDLCKRIK